MPLQVPSRREFLKFTAAAMGGGWLVSNASLVMAAARQAQEARASARGFNHLSQAEAATLGALCDQIFPPDLPPGDLPGASELGAVYFIDAAVGGFMAGELATIREGLADLDARSGNSNTFHQLGFDQQTGIVRQVEKTPLFGIVHFLTLLGLFALPSYGGNTDGAAWKMLGYEPRHHWQPPFGYYDEQYTKLNGSAGENGHAGS
jgi:hypothetical protein